MFATEQCLLVLYHHPRIWHSAAQYLDQSSKLLAEKGVRISINLQLMESYNQTIQVALMIIIIFKIEFRFEYFFDANKDQQRMLLMIPMEFVENSIQIVCIHFKANSKWIQVAKCFHCVVQSIHLMITNPVHVSILWNDPKTKRIRKWKHFVTEKFIVFFFRLEFQMNEFVTQNNSFVKLPIFRLGFKCSQSVCRWGSQHIWTFY